MKYSNELCSDSDFQWYKKSLDCHAKYQHRHIGKPERYPCRVSSEWSDDPNGPYTYNHEFIYQKCIICKECGHHQLEWPTDFELTQHNI